MSKELIIQKESIPLVSKANELKIKTPEDMTQAVEVLSQLNKYLDKATEEKEKVTKPLNEALKAERARWKPLETMYEQAITMIRSKMTAYQTELVRLQKEKEQKIADRISKGTLKMETGIKKLENLPTVEKEHATEKGLVQFREKKQLKVTDLSLIPDEYWSIREDDILADLKKGVQIPGAEIETIQVPINYR